MLDYIIVGAGLSGIALAEELLEKGKKISVFENNSQSSSTVAGGLYNPVILKRFTLAWNANKQLATALPFYRSIENRLQCNLIQELPVFRKFHSVEEQNNWFQAMDKPQLAPFLKESLQPHLNSAIPSSHSFGQVLGTGRVDTALLLEKYRDFLKDTGRLEPKEFKHSSLVIEEEGISYESLKARKVVFCEGYGLKENPFFNFLPLHGNKGEYLIIKAVDLKLEVAVKASVFILPLGNDLYKVGATYDNKDTTSLPTKPAKETLQSQLSKMITCNYEVVGQVAGIRPATRDRKPVVGQHPVHKDLYCCNGFGSRGVLIAPVMAKDLVANMEYGTPLDPEVDIYRFSKFFYNSEKG